MARMVQVRNVPEKVHRELARRAKARGLTLTRYLEEILVREVSRPSRDEVFARIRAAGAIDLKTPVAEILRQERETRGRP